MRLVGCGYCKFLCGAGCVLLLWNEGSQAFTPQFPRRILKRKQLSAAFSRFYPKVRRPAKEEQVVENPSLVIQVEEEEILPHFDADKKLQQDQLSDNDVSLLQHAALDSGTTRSIVTSSASLANVSKESLEPKPKKQKQKLPGAVGIANFLSQPMVELAEAMLVVFSTLFVAIDTLDNLAPSVCTVVGTAGDIVAYIFCVIFGLRWYANAEQGPKYFAKPFVLVDIFVVILPLLLPILYKEHLLLPSTSFVTSQGGLITLRLLRILRLQRVLSSMEHFANFQRALGVTNPTDVKPYKLQLARVILSLSTLLSVAAGLIYTTEHEVNPALPDYFTALYFGLTTITTVGFGDITPVTTGGKLVVCGSILAGVAIIPGQAAALFEALLESDKQRAELERDLPLSLAATSTDSLDSEPQQQQPTEQQQRGRMLDPVTPCGHCGTTLHWVDATYCWSCGKKLEM